MFKRSASVLAAHWARPAKQLACSPSEWTWLVLTYRSDQLNCSV